MAHTYLATYEFRYAWGDDETTESDRFVIQTDEERFAEAAGKAISYEERKRHHYEQALKGARVGFELIKLEKLFPLMKDSDDG